MEVLRLIKKYRQKQRLINKCQKELERCVHLVLFSYNKRSIQSNSARVKNPLPLQLVQICFCTIPAWSFIGNAPNFIQEVHGFVEGNGSLLIK
jgi:hypothetical protein